MFFSQLLFKEPAAIQTQWQNEMYILFREIFIIS